MHPTRTPPYRPNHRMVEVALSTTNASSPSMYINLLFFRSRKWLPREWLPRKWLPRKWLPRRQDRKHESAIVNCEYNVAPFSGSERKKRRPVSKQASRACIHHASCCITHHAAMQPKPKLAAIFNFSSTKTRKKQHVNLDTRGLFKHTKYTRKGSLSVCLCWVLFVFSSLRVGPAVGFWGAMAGGQKLKFGSPLSNFILESRQLVQAVAEQFAPDAFVAELPLGLLPVSGGLVVETEIQRLKKPLLKPPSRGFPPKSLRLVTGTSWWPWEWWVSIPYRVTDLFLSALRFLTVCPSRPGFPSLLLFSMSLLPPLSLSWTSLASALDDERCTIGKKNADGAEGHGDRARRQGGLRGGYHAPPLPEVSAGAAWLLKRRGLGGHETKATGTVYSVYKKPVFSGFSGGCYPWRDSKEVGGVKELPCCCYLLRPCPFGAGIKSVGL